MKETVIQCEGNGCGVYGPVASMRCASGNSREQSATRRSKWYEQTCWSALERHIRPAIGLLPFAKVTRTDIRAT